MEDTKEKRKLLQRCMDDAVAANELAGCLFCVIRGGREEIYLESGYADIASGRRMARDDIFRIYSMTKPVTAAAFMTLVENGYVDVSDPVGKYLESFRHQCYELPDGSVVPVDTRFPMEIRHLLHMTSGLCYPHEETRAGRETGRVYEEAGRRLGTDSAMTTQEFADRIGSCTLLFAPGTQWHYGVSADILGAVAEKVTGMKFSDFMKESILRPTGMTDTDFHVPAEKRSRLVTAYRNQGGAEGAPLEPFTGNHLGIRNDGGENPLECGGAGLFSTLDDYIRFTQMLMRGGVAENGRRVLRPGTVRHMTSGRLTQDMQAQFERNMHMIGYTYSSLNRVMIDPSRAETISHMGEYGWDGWLGVYYANDPQADQTILLMLNHEDFGTSHLTRRLRNIVNSWT